MIRDLVNGFIIVLWPKNEIEQRKISLLQNDPEEKCQARVISELMSLYEANCMKTVQLKKHLASS